MTALMDYLRDVAAANDDGKENLSMDFLISHWHCILPVMGIGIALFFMRERPKKEKKDEQNNIAEIPQQNKRD